MRRKVIDRYAGPTTLGIDVSYYDQTIDWATVKTSHPELGFVVVRTGDGARVNTKTVPDPRCVENLTGASAAGFDVLGVYHYLRAFHSAQVQADVIFDQLATAGVRPAFVAIDIEGRPQSAAKPVPRGSLGAWWTADAKGVSTNRVLDCASELRGLLEEKGHRVVMYTAVSWHFYVAQKRMHDPSWARCPLWTPNYTRKPAPLMPVDPDGKAAPWAEWTIWQYSATGTIRGIPKRSNGKHAVDMNRFRGDPAALRAWASTSRA